jgi:hydroxymethylpyrimidine pyrophosphatase-like HAD family hydrolase
MHYTALATDYDGTIAYEGTVDQSTLAALDRARRAGFTLLLVTGRELVDLFDTFPHCSMFQRVVAENGAVLYTPDSKAVRTLADAPPPSLLEALARQAVPVSVGRSIVATVEPHEHSVLTAIHDLGLEWHVIFNKGSVMALPADVTKATGLQAALEELGIACQHVVGIGDAENDQAFLRMCGLSVAVANALPSVKAGVHMVMPGERGTGVVELIDRLLAGDLDTAF